MEKWKIDFLDICNFSKKVKRKMNETLQKIKNGARAPPFFIFQIFLALSFLKFLEKLNFWKITYKFNEEQREGASEASDRAGSS